jgi:predicted RNase H-like HicB family nuclease
MQTDHYPAHIFWSMDDQAFIAIAPDLPGCSAVGDTQAEALSELQDAIIGWCEAAKAAGNPIPAPSELEHSA